MSYINPQLSQADPLAFSKGFEAAFQKQQAAFKAQLEEKNRIAREAQAAEATLISATDLGGYQDLDEKIYDAFQNNIRGMVDSNSFVNMSPGEKQKTIFELRDFKQSFEKFRNILSLPASQIDKRNSDILELKTAVVSNPNEIQITGSGLDMSINFKTKSGQAKSISLKKLNSTRLIDTTEFEDTHKKFDASMFNSANSILLAGAKSGKYAQAEQLVLNDYATQLQDQFDEEDYAYVYTNKIGGEYGGSPEELEQKKTAVINYKINEYKQAIDSRKEYAEIFAPKPEIEKPEPAPKTTEAERNRALKIELNDWFNVDPIDAAVRALGSQISRDKKTGEPKIVFNRETNTYDIENLDGDTAKFSKDELFKEIANKAKGIEDILLKDYRERKAFVGSLSEAAENNDFLD